MPRFKKLKKNLTNWFTHPWYPIAFSAYPALALLAANAGQVQLSAGNRALAISILLSALIYFLSWLIMRQTHRAAFLSLLLLILFFTYGHGHNLLLEKYPDDNIDAWLTGIWGFLFLLALVLATRSRFNYDAVASSLNVIALALIVVSGWQISSQSTPGHTYSLGAENAPVQEDLVRVENPADVYFFLLDCRL